jgi:hypothetical protein
MVPRTAGELGKMPGLYLGGAREPPPGNAGRVARAGIDSTHVLEAVTPRATMQERTSKFR